MNKLAKIINSLGEEDLLKIKRDLVAGNIDKLIEKKLTSLHEEKFDSKQCPICDGKIGADSLMVEFGKPYLRRRAFFDGVDCLEYFLNSKLKKELNSANDINSSL